VAGIDEEPSGWRRCGKARGEDGAAARREPVGSVAAVQIGCKTAGFQLFQEVRYIKEPDLMQLMAAPAVFADTAECFYASEQNSLRLVVGSFDLESPVFSRPPRPSRQRRLSKSDYIEN
jgi:hypothetical protein